MTRLVNTNISNLIVFEKAKYHRAESNVQCALKESQRNLIKLPIPNETFGDRSRQNEKSELPDFQ